MFRKQNDMYMVKMYYPVVRHSFFCLKRNIDDYTCSCNYGVKYKTKYIHCSELKTPHDLWIEDQKCHTKSDLENLQKYYFWLLKEKGKKKND